VVIDNDDVKRIPILPAKADAPLIVDANAVLTGAVAFELLQTVAGRDAEVFELLRGINQREFAQHQTLELAGKATHKFATEQSLAVPIGETLDHRK